LIIKAQINVAKLIANPIIEDQFPKVSIILLNSHLVFIMLPKHVHTHTNYYQYYNTTKSPSVMPEITEKYTFLLFLVLGCVSTIFIHRFGAYKLILFCLQIQASKQTNVPVLCTSQF